MNAPDTTILTEARSLSTLATMWRAAKRAEDDARDRRYAIEAQICMELPADGVEGSRSEKLDGVKVSVTYGLTRSVDTAALQDKWGTLDPDAQKCFTWKASVSVSELRKYEGHAIAPFITTKPAKPSVKVEIL